MNKIDYIIVGQGLAGSVLAQQLLDKNQQIIVVDEVRENTSSRVAAGLCNPIVFKRLTKSWMIDNVLENAKAFYRKQEALLDNQFYYEVPLYKLFASDEEKDFWRQKSNEPDLFDWLNPKVEFPFDKALIDYEHGASCVLNSGFLQTEKWLNTFREHLIKLNCFVAEKFNYEAIVFEEDSVTWEDYTAKKIIFCEGYQCINNPYFDWLPFKLTKGEVLTINFEKLVLKAAINKGAFILPYNNNYKLGATYNWDMFDEKPTEKGKAELIHKAKKFIKDKIVVIEHKAGIRPTVKDRRPLLGLHPKNELLAVFNGMGTKGVMLAPYFANNLVDLLLENKPLTDDIDIKRFI